MDEPKSPEEVVTSILDAFGRTYREAAEALNSIPDPKQAFEAVDSFDSRLRALHNQQVPLLRALQVRRSRKQQPGSLAQLAQRFNRSKSRIKQYDDLASQAKEEASCHSSPT